MFDCGIPFNRMKDELYKCHTLLITHTHSDHIKKQTLQRIIAEFPRITICGNSDVAYQYPLDKIVGEKPFQLKDGTTVFPFDGEHDVPVTGYGLILNGENVLYATDTTRVINPFDDKIDYFFLESNYNEHKLAELRKEYRKGNYDPADSSLRHLSTQQCKKFYWLNRRSPDSLLVELHKSSRFY